MHKPGGWWYYTISTMIYVDTMVNRWYTSSMNTGPKARETHKITVELPQDLWDAVRALAEEHQRSFVKELVWALQDYVKRERRSRSDR